MATKAPEILDLDKLVPPKRLVKLAGKEIDVSKISSIITLKIADTREDLSEDNPESMNLAWDIVMEIIDSQNSGITKDWLLEKTDIIQLIAFFDFILRPIKERVAGGGKKRKTARAK